jgi:uncharacterized Zn finger protein
MPSRDVPSAVTTRCPSCGKETLHTVLHGRTSGATLDATVQCTTCETTHHAIVRQSRDVEVPVVLSAGSTSTRTRLTLPDDEALRLEDPFIVDGADARLTGIETRDGKRVEAALVREVQTLWMKRFDEVEVGFAINLDKKTITKSLKVEPTREFTVGEEHVFGRLRVTVHAIKTDERLLKRGSAPAGEIRRIFARPTPLARPEHRPDKRTREQMRAKEDGPRRRPK